MIVKQSKNRRAQTGKDDSLCSWPNDAASYDKNNYNYWFQEVILPSSSVFSGKNKIFLFFSTFLVLGPKLGLSASEGSIIIVITNRKANAESN